MAAIAAEQDNAVRPGVIRELYERMSPCRLCPRNCGTERAKGLTGYCGIGARARVSSFGPHFGEESVLVGRGGSGTIFFAGCNLGCVFCQNYEISQLRQGSDADVEELAEMMLALAGQGCSNVNLVTPTHMVGPIVAAIDAARRRGMRLPIVYNSGGYDSVETLRLLEGWVDIYMPDMKYGRGGAAELSDAADYAEINRAAVKEMHWQVGDLEVADGLARRGLLIRHLVLPRRQAGSFAVLDFLADEVSARTAVNVMDQYRPCHRACEYPKIARRPTQDEVREVIDYARGKNLRIID